MSYEHITPFSPSNPLNSVTAAHLYMSIVLPQKLSTVNSSSVRGEGFRSSTPMLEFWLS